jgi:hypothetical protein
MFNNTDMSWEANADETTVYSNNDRTYITGLRNSTLSFSGFFAAGTSATQSDTVIGPDVGQAGLTNITFGPDGLTQGDVTYSVTARYTNYSISAPVDGVVTITLDAQGSAELVRGHSLHDLTAVTSSGNGAAYNLTSGSSRGATGYVHVTSISLASTESIAIAVQDSATSTPGSWTDLIAFTAITCSVATSEKATATGNVDQYVRSEWEYLTCDAASNTVTFAISFERATTQ